MPSSSGRLLTLLLLAGAVFRVSLVESFHTSSPDGNQYQALAGELVRAGRFAYAPPPAPLAYSRLPGFPLFIAHVGRALAPASGSLTAGTARANALLEVGTALLVYLLLRRCRASTRTALLGAIAALLCPVQILFASYCLSETLTTFLLSLSLLLSLRCMDSGAWWAATAAGGTVGLALLCRADAIALLPIVLAAACAARVGWPARLRLCGALLAALFLVLLPWVARNQMRFGSPHPWGSEWMTIDGEPLGGGFMRWMRTWSTGAPSEGAFGLPIYYRRPLPPGSVTARMWDDPAQRAQLLEMVETYNRDGRLTAELDARFDALAWRRTRAAPLRTFVALPLARMERIYQAPEETDYPLDLALFRLPHARAVLFPIWDVSLYLLALLGAWVLARERGGPRARAILLLGAIAARSLLHAWAVPTYVSQRYLVEVFPVMIVLAALGAVSAGRALRTGWHRLASRR